MSLLPIISSVLDAPLERIKAHRQTIKSIGALASGNLAGSLLGAVGGILVARFVDPEVNGQFRLYTIPLMYLTFLHLGTFDGLYRQIPFFVGSNQPDHVEKIASATGAWNIFVSTVVASGFLLCALRGFWHGNRIDAVGWLTQALTCAGIYYGGYLSATYRTLDNFVALARINLIQTVITFCFVFTVAFLGFYGLCLRAALPSLLGVWLYHRARPLRVPLRFDFAALKGVVKIGMPFCFWGTLYSSFWLAAEYTLIVHFSGVKGVGLYSVAVVMRESLSILPQSVHQVLLPRVVESYAREGSVRAAAIRTFQVAGALSIFMVIVVLIISVLLNYFVPLFIPKYVEGLPLMKVCLGVAIIHAASLPLNGLVASGRSWLYGKGILSGLIAFPLVVFLLNPFIGGLMAVAFGSLTGRVVRTIVAYFDFFSLIQQESR